MPAFLAFAAGAVVGAAASSLVRNRRLICKTLELAGTVQEKLCSLCRSGKEQVGWLFRHGQIEADAALNGPIAVPTEALNQPAEEVVPHEGQRSG
jgi:hypothetical protein